MKSDETDLLKDVEKLKTQINRLQERVCKLTYYDPLTQLPNHRKLNKTVTQAINSSPETEKALIVIDLDRFHTINELYGKTVGDQVLVLISHRLQTLFQQDETVYRGIEELVVFFEDISYDKLATLGEMMQEALKKPFVVKENVFYISASVGMSHYPTTGLSVETLLSQAEMAMKKAKRKGRGNCQVFRPQDAEQIERIRMLEFGLDEAVENEELYLLYQPKIELEPEKCMASKRC